MKKTAATFVTHLLRGALYAPMLLAICAIPFALAQQRGKKTAANHAASSDMPVVQSADGVVRGTQGVPPALTAPEVACSYSTSTGSGTITPGTTDTGNHCDDCATAITFPFPVSVYGQTFNSANVASNGSLDLIGTETPFTHGCQVLPSALWTMAILPYQDDLRTDNLGFAGCSGFPGGNCGVFYSITGTAPNRQFNIEWRAVHFADPTTSANFEVVFSENQSSFDVIYGATSDNGLDETSGVQASATGPATTFSCGTATLTNGLEVTYICGTPTPTPTPTCFTNVTGSIDTSDPTQVDRLFRSGIPQTCPASTTCAIFGDPTPHHYDAYTLTNTTGATQCVTVDTNTACTGTNFIFIAAYLGSFDPNNICTNWIGDAGSSPNPEQTFSFNLDNGQTVVLVVSEATPDAGCPAYTMTVFGLCGTVPTDFNHDGFPDLVLFKPATLNTAVWFLDNHTFAGSAYGPTLPPGWNVIDSADFDGDQNPDYALFNTSTRQTAIWYLHGTSFSSSAYGPTSPSGWALIAVRDFNNDGHPDYVLYNATTRQTAIWFLNNNAFMSSSYGPTLPSGWSLAGVGDFNRDGQPDYALFNTSTRQTAIWYLNGTSFSGSAYGPTIASGYGLIGVADFDISGKPDFLLFKATTRQTAIWYLNNNSFVGSAYGPTPPLGWIVVAP